MACDNERIERIKRALKEAGLDAVVCALPINVLLLSGYWPVVGTSLAIAARDGHITVLAPKDEEELARKGCADELHTFQPGSLERITEGIESTRELLANAIRALGIMHGRIGYEDGAISEPASYAAMNLYGRSIVKSELFSSATLVPADEMLAYLRSVKTRYEINRIRISCRIAEMAFLEGANQIRAGLKETDVAARFRTPLSTFGTGYEGVGRADGFTFCMSGANSADAYGAYARSRSKEVGLNEFALVHCNSYADGFWTDITRTYCVCELDERKRRMYDAVFEARRAAIESIHPGIKAAEVDRAAREVLKAHGFDREFKHPTGHGVGFAVISHNALPRIHPKSDDILEIGMVFNIEPAIYIDGYGGLRQCDMVAVGEIGAEVLTPFQLSIEDLIVG